MPWKHRRWTTCLWLVVGSLGSATTTLGAEPEPSRGAAQRDQAGAAFDEAVGAFDRADYAHAARAFLRADALLPSADALLNALVAAERAHDDTLAATAARRALARETPALAARGRATLARVEPHTARLVLACQPSPCTLSLDDETVPEGLNYATPGEHVIVARTPAGSREQRVTASAGVEYSLEVAVDAPTPSEPVPSVRQNRTDSKPAHPEDAPAASTKPLPPAVFYASGAATVALAGVATWSGIDALRARDRLPNPPTAEENEDVRARAHRTDLLLVGTAALAAATAVLGLTLVDWHAAKPPGVRSALALDVARGEILFGVAVTQ